MGPLRLLKTSMMKVSKMPTELAVKDSQTVAWGVGDRVQVTAPLCGLDHSMEITDKKLVSDEGGEKISVSLPTSSESLADRLLVIDKRLEPFRKTTLTVLERGNE